MEPAPARFSPLALLVVLTSALCWWPSLLEPRFDLPEWLPFALCALATGAAALLRQDRWLAFALSAAASAPAGFLTGISIFPPSDGKALAVAPASALLILVAILAAHCAPERWLPPRLLWSTLGACALYSPVALAITALLVSPRQPAP